MIPMLAIPIITDATAAVAQSTSFFAQPFDAILFDIFVWTAWIPIVITLGWGFLMMWINYRIGGYVGTLKYVLLAIDVPSFTEQSPKAVENLFAAIYGAKSTITWKEKWIYGKVHPVFSFEIISNQGYIQFLVRCQTRFRDIIEAGIYANYPDAEIAEVEDYAKDFPGEFPNDEYEMWGGELTLDKHYMYPIKTYVDFEDRLTQELKDPLGYTLEQLAKMRPGEHFWIQFLVRPETNNWTEDGLRHVRKIYGDEDAPKKSAITAFGQAVLSFPSEVLKEALDVDLSGLLFSEDQPVEVDQWKAFKITLAEKDEAEAILRKTTKVGHACKFRILYVAKKNAFVKIERTAMVKGILNQYAHLNFNRFGLYVKQVPKDDYWWMRLSYTKRQSTLMKAYQGRSWGAGANPVYLNAEELASLWHFPAVYIRAPLVKKSESKRSEPPVGLPITSLEQTLVGVGADGMEQSVFPGADTETVVSGAPAIDLSISGEPGALPETLPQPTPPTGSREEIVVPEPTQQLQKVNVESIGQETQDSDDDSFAPTDLPI